jgi:hypothetical protein
MGPYSLSGGRMPPVLHISFDKLVGGAKQYLVAGEHRFGIDESHDILQLITITESSP